MDGSRVSETAAASTTGGQPAAGTPPSHPSWQVGDRIADLYQVLAVHEQGAMGLVYRVRHLAWDVDLAVKSPRPQLFHTEAEKELFTREAETWVSLGLHPHVCGCHYVRTLDRFPRVFAEYVDGGSLREWIHDRRLYQDGPRPALARVLDVAIQMAWGLAHAHQHGVVHQDVKPANLLLDGTGTAKVTDFGLARARPPGRSLELGGGGTMLVTTGGMTPAYASPEQAAGEQVGRRSDLWSFAASVLEMFTGEVTWSAGPVAGAALAEFRRSGTGGPLPLPGAVAEVLAGCLQDDPADRPESMVAIARQLVDVYRRETGDQYPRDEPRVVDLQADELNNRALSLLDLGRTEQAEMAFRKALTLDPQHLAATFNQGLRRWRAGALTDDTLLTDLAAVGANTGSPWQVKHLLAQVHLERGDPAAAQPLLADAAQQAPDDPQLRADLRAVDSGDHAAGRRLALPSSGSTPRPGGRAVLSGDDRLAAVVDEWVVSVWDTGTGERLHTFQHAEPVTCVRLSADGRWLLTATRGEPGYQQPAPASLHLIRTDTGQYVHTIPTSHQHAITSLHLDRDAQFALSHCAAEATARLWDLAGGKELSWHRAYCVGGGDGVAVSGGADGAVCRWDLHTGRGELLAGNHPNGVKAVGVSPDGQFALSVSGMRPAQQVFGMVRLWDLAAQQCLNTFSPTGGKLLGGALYNAAAVACLGAAGQPALTSGDLARVVQVWDPRSGRQLGALPCPDEAVAALGLSPDGQLALLYSDPPGTVRLWELATGRCRRTLRGHQPLAGGRGLLTGDGQGAVWQWTLPPRPYTARFQVSRPRSHTRLSELQARVDTLVRQAAQAVAGGAFPAARDLLEQARQTPGWERAPAVLAAWHALGLWSTRTGLRAAWPVRVLEGHRGPIASVWVSPDGARASSAVDIGEGQVWEWELATGRLVRSTTGGRALVDSRAVSQDGQLSIAVRGDLVQVFDRHSGKCLRSLRHKSKPYQARVVAAALSLDGRFVLSADDSKRTVHWWNVAGGTHWSTWGKHAAGLTDVCLSVDGRLALSASKDSTVRVWETATSSCRRVLTGHRGEVSSVCLSADNRFALSAGQDRTVRVWDLATGQCLRAIDAGRPVTAVGLSPDGRFILAGGDGSVQVWEADWELAAHDPADWDEGARPYLAMFLTAHTPFAGKAPQDAEPSERQVRLALTRRGRPSWQEADVDRLLRQLQLAGYGWLRPQGVRAELERMAQGWKKPPSMPAPLDR